MQSLLRFEFFFFCYVWGFEIFDVFVSDPPEVEWIQSEDILGMVAIVLTLCLNNKCL